MLRKCEAVGEMKTNDKVISSKAPVQIIFDTDMGNDIDDALALAMLHAFQSRGECELRSVVVSKDNPYAAGYVDALNTFYRRGDIPIGLVIDGVTPEDGTYARQVVELENDQGGPLFPRTTPDLHSYSRAVDELRCRLAEADDDSIVMLMVGFSTNMAHLFESSPDGYSELGGLDLFSKKVKRVVIMAADFSEDVQTDPTLRRWEYNVRQDIPSARCFIEKCRCPIYFAGFEVGLEIPYASTLLDSDYGWCNHHPVVEGYKRYKPMPYDRPTWDLTAVLFAVRPDRGYFGLSESGVAVVEDDGVVRFVPNDKGRHYYLTIDESQKVIVGEVQSLLAAQPY